MEKKGQFLNNLVLIFAIVVGILILVNIDQITSFAVLQGQNWTVDYYDADHDFWCDKPLEDYGFTLACDAESGLCYRNCSAFTDEENCTVNGCYWSPKGVCKDEPPCTTYTKSGEEACNNALGCAWERICSYNSSYCSSLDLQECGEGCSVSYAAILYSFYIVNYDQPKYITLDANNYFYILDKRSDPFGATSWSISKYDNTSTKELLLSIYDNNIFGDLEIDRNNEFLYTFYKKLDPVGNVEGYYLVRYNLSLDKQDFNISLGLDTPNSLAMDSEGNFYVWFTNESSGEDYIVKYDTNGNELLNWSLSSLSPVSMTIYNDEIYVLNEIVNYNELTVYKFDTSGNLITTFSHTGDFWSTRGVIAVSPLNGDIILFVSNSIWVFSSDFSRYNVFWVSNSAVDVAFSNDYHLFSAFYYDNNIYVYGACAPDYTYSSNCTSLDADECTTYPYCYVDEFCAISCEMYKNAEELCLSDEACIWTTKIPPRRSLAPPGPGGPIRPVSTEMEEEVSEEKITEGPVKGERPTKVAVTGRFFESEGRLESISLPGCEYV